jgi:hypothetical protein
MSESESMLYSPREVGQALGEFHRRLDSRVETGMCSIRNRDGTGWEFESTEAACSWSCEDLNRKSRNNGWSWSWHPIG